eukprot:SAG25_NODE_2201_length_1844_cov_270.328358_2_plen_308_part_00
MLAQHHHYSPELTAPRPGPAFPLLLGITSYASRAERVRVNGGVNKHHTTASSARNLPALAHSSLPDSLPTAIWAAFTLKSRARYSRCHHPQPPERVEKPAHTANEHQFTGVTPPHHSLVTWLPCTHTHVDTLYTRAQPVNHTVPLESQGTGSPAAKRSGEGQMAWSARRDASLSRGSPPRFGRLRALGARLPAPAHLKRRATVVCNREGTPPPQRRATGRRTRWLRQQSGAEEGGGRCSMLEAFARRGGRIVRSPYPHTTRPSGRVSCGGPAKRVGGAQARKCGKEGKPVGGRATTITAASSREIPC